MFGTWNHRIIKWNTPKSCNSPVHYSMEEVFYDEKGKPFLHTERKAPMCFSLKELKETYNLMMKALEQPSVKEIIKKEKKKKK